MLECSKSDGLESEIAMETPSDFSNKSSKRESWNTQGGLLLCIADIIKPVHYMLKPFLKQLQRLRLLLAVLFRILNFSPYADLIVSLRPFFVRLIGLGGAAGLAGADGPARAGSGGAGLLDSDELDELDDEVDVLDVAGEGVRCIDSGTSLNSSSAFYC
jgi:hypothetical protein